MDIGSRLRKLRLERGLTQEQVAKPRYSSAYISTIEAGKRVPSTSALTHFAGRLGVDPAELISGQSPGRRAELLAKYGEARRILAGAAPNAIEEAQARLTRLARAAKREGFRDVEAKATIALGLCAETRNDLDAALAIYEGCLDSLGGDGPLIRLDAVVGRARVLQTKGDVAYAAFLIEKAIAELGAEKLDDPSALVRLYSSLVAAYFDAGLIEQADGASEHALKLAVLVEDPERLANMNLNVGIMLAQSGRWQEAETRLAEAQRWFDELHFVVDLARVRLVRGINLRNQERFDEARSHLTAAREAFAAADSKLRDARATVALGILERRAGRLDDATFLLKRAISLAETDEGIAGIAHRELALCLQDRGKAISGLRKAIGLLERAGIAKELAATYRALGDVLSNDKELKPACDAYRKAADLFERAA